MKCAILLSATFVATSFFANAQNASKTYAITGKAGNSFYWADIKEVDISTGKVIQTLFEADKTVFKSVIADQAARALMANEARPAGLGVAACALDVRHNRLYFTPMHFSDIRFLDLAKKDVSFTTIKRNVIPTNSTQGYQTEENHITRMVIAADGYGYALSNDANHLIRFSTGKKAVVENLGSLIDAESNNGISIHNKCTGWGGDMVADAFGKLVIVSAGHNVFDVDINSRIVSLTGTISGLPANFTTNGAAVNDEGDLIVSSANVFDGLYKVNMKTLAAVKVKSDEPAFNASDMANGNFLSQKEFNNLTRYDLAKSPVTNNTDGKVYPNPLTGSQFNVSFEGQPSGKYTIVLTDIAGKAFQSKVINVFKPDQVETIRLTGNTARGMYLVKVLSGNSKQLAFSEKVVVN